VSPGDLIYVAGIYGIIINTHNDRHDIFLDSRMWYNIGGTLLKVVM
jgi:hypothetical protein